MKYYELGHCEDRLLRAYYMLEDFSGLEKLADNLPESHKDLAKIGKIFAAVGMCDQAVNAFIRVSQILSSIIPPEDLVEWFTIY